MTKYKAIICDVDGTLVPISDPFDPQPVPSKEVIEIVSAVQKKIHFGIATARSIVYARHLFKELDLNGPSILQSGSLIVDAKSLKVLWKKQIEKTDFEKIIVILKKLKLSYLIDEIDKTGIAPLNYKYNNPLCLFVPLVNNKGYELIEKSFSHLKKIRIQKVHWNNNSLAVNLTNSEASKQHAVLEVAKILNIKTDEIIGIGDSYNDFPLLMACGLKVAMGNAVDEIKAIADYVAPTVEEDGVVDAINKFVL